MTTLALRTTSLVAGWLFAACLASCSTSPPSNERPGSSAQAYSAHWPLSFGTRCQADFQNNWDPVWNNYGMCSNFNNGIASYSGNNDSVAFYYNLHGAQNDIQTPSDTCFSCGGADSVDFFLIATHGNYDSSRSRFAMWDSYTRAYTDQMRLGDDGWGLQAWAGYSCDTLYTSDNNFWTRWFPVYAGGVKLILGAYANVYDGNDQKGTELASRLENGEPVGFAWNEAVWYADNSNTPLSTASGANSNDCWNRHGANLNAMEGLSRLQDGAIGYMCWSGWQ